MFKFAKQFLERNAERDTPPPSPTYFDPLDIPTEPELVIGKEVSIVGKIAFQREIHINGLFEGEIEGGSKIVIGVDGFVKAHLNLDEAEISGKVEGDITVKTRLILRGTAEVRGNITAPLLSVDEGVSIIGQVCVPAAPTY